MAEGAEGHVLMGLVFLVIGIWHLYNNIKNHSTLRNYISLQWFPSSFSRYIELYLIMLGCSMFSLSEIKLARLHRDGTVKATHLHSLEHFCIASGFFLHALSSILLDKIQPKPLSHIDIGHFVGAMAFAIELLIFHFHTSDHVGLQGQYHWLLQQLISVCIITSLLSIWLPKSFMVCFIRSLTVIFQGLWLIVMGIMLWTPEFAPKGCSIQKDDYGPDLIKCDQGEALHRAKALVNILFGWFFIAMMACGVGFYLIVNKVLNAYGFTEVHAEEGGFQLEQRQGSLNYKRVRTSDLEEQDTNMM